ncbi:hypothetical protein LEN26_015380 [Aphanomyces euteiches]|nr:hypothetical protein LEN26_015380 [Aphanomyces euteiches]KAH9115769.1 hypothetical protein AeMF1_010214 [Aphanomyces euteiches]KAH9197064.1 hypothetical protein AeNC1_000962 [Aphanomyces euteiches]
MGAAASLQSLGALEIAIHVEQLGEAYKDYADCFVKNGVDGAILSQLNENDLDSLLVDLGIASSVHRKLLGLHLGKFKLIPRPASKRRPLPRTLPTHVTQPPSILLGKLFAFQGVHLIDPDDLSSVIDKICYVAGPSQCDGETTYDCFVNYRVATEKVVAEKLYLHLQTHQLHPFLDRFCLKNGEPWREGFIRGLTQSRIFVALVSQAGLAKCRDDSVDHGVDNLLLEYEVALTMAEADPSFVILPVYVAATVAGGGFIKFQDFASDIYSPTVHPKEATQSGLVDQINRTCGGIGTLHSHRHVLSDDATDVNRKISLSESSSANVPELLREALYLNKSALEMLFGLAQRSKHAAKIVAAGGVTVMFDILASDGAVEVKDVAAAVLSLLARSLERAERQATSDNVWELFVADRTQEVLLTILSSDSDIQKHYVVMGLVHVANCDASVKARLLQSKDLVACLHHLAETGPAVLRGACLDLLQ